MKVAEIQQKYFSGTLAQGRHLRGAGEGRPPPPPSGVVAKKEVGIP